MSRMIEISDDEDVKRIIREVALIDPIVVEDFFSSFLRNRYGITLEQFDNVIKTTIPEHMI